MHDTSAANRQRYVELLRQLTPAEKLRAVVRLNAGLRRLALAGVRRQCPEATATEHRRLLAARLYGQVGSTVFG